VYQRFEIFRPSRINKYKISTIPRSFIECKVFNARSNSEIPLNGFLDLYKSSLTIDSWTNSNEFENSICLSGAHSKKLFQLSFLRCAEIYDSDSHVMLSSKSQNESIKNQKIQMTMEWEILDSTTRKHLRVNPLQLRAWFKYNLLKRLITGTIRLFDWFNRLDWLWHDNSLLVRPWTCI
jgi:hypothetical protein